MAVLGLFILSHAVPAMPTVRRRLIARFGNRAFLIGYSLLSIALFAWLIRELGSSPSTPLWPVSRPGFGVALVLMPLMLALFGAALPAPNPLSVSVAPGPYDPERPGAVAITRHPLLWGLALWGFAHVPANGDSAALLFFGGLGSFAMLGMLLIEKRKRSTLGEERWKELAAQTSFFPFVALLTGRARWPRDRRTFTGALAGLLVALFLLAGGHSWLFSRDPLALF